MSTPPAAPGPEMSVEIDDATAAGLYANLAIVSHSETEFVIDFIFNSPQPPKAKVRTRVLTSPVHMKRLLEALKENVARYEARFGAIKNPSSESGTDRRMGFFQ